MWPCQDCSRPSTQSTGRKVWAGGEVRSNGKGVSSLQKASWCRPSVPGRLVMGPIASKLACQGSTGYSEEETRKIGQLKLTRLGGVEMWSPSHRSFGSHVTGICYFRACHINLRTSNQSLRNYVKRKKVDLVLHNCDVREGQISGPAANQFSLTWQDLRQWGTLFQKQINNMGGSWNSYSFTSTNTYMDILTCIWVFLMHKYCWIIFS